MYLSLLLTATSVWSKAVVVGGELECGESDGFGVGVEVTMELPVVPMERSLSAGLAPLDDARKKDMRMESGSKTTQTQVLSIFH